MNDSTTTAPWRVTSRFGGQSNALDVIAGIDLLGLTAIVTGGASGIGVETVRALASAGAKVTIAARDMAAGERVATEINGMLSENRVDAMRVELGSFASIRAFAAEWGDRPINILVNNAGVMACPLGYTEDGFETQLGVNHLGHFLLTTLLTPAIEAGYAASGKPSRVVQLSSSAHGLSDIDFDDPHFRSREYHPTKSYGQSKTANALFAVEYDRRYRDRGIRAFAVMPGIIQTKLARHMSDDQVAAIGFDTLDRSDPNAPGVRSFKNVTQGASTSIWAATAPELEGKGGLYLNNCEQAEPMVKNGPRGEGVRAYALDPARAAQLWTISEAAVAAAWSTQAGRC